MARELELRGRIDQLELCLSRLQEKVDRATEEERECQSRIDRLAAMGKEQQVAQAPLAPTESQGPDEQSGPARAGSVSAERRVEEGQPATSLPRLGPSGRDAREGLENLIQTALDSDEARNGADEQAQEQGGKAQGATSPNPRSLETDAQHQLAHPSAELQV